MDASVTFRVPEMYSVPADVVYGEIKTLEKITPEAILEKARDESSALHEIFEWDDSVAAEKYRLSQAKNLISNLVIKPAIKGETTTIRVLHKTEPGIYKSIKYVVQHKEEYELILARALQELQRFQKKYETLVELQSVFDEITKLEI